MKRISPDIPHLYTRGKNFIFRLVIPAHLRGLAGKSEFKVSLSTRVFTLALKKYSEVEPYYQNLMEKLHSGETLTSSAYLSYEELVKMAAIQGRTYKPIDELTQNPAEFMKLIVTGPKQVSQKALDSRATSALFQIQSNYLASSRFMKTIKYTF